MRARDAQTTLQRRGGPGEVALSQMSEAKGKEAMGKAEGTGLSLAGRDPFVRSRRRLTELAYLDECSREETTRAHGQGSPREIGHVRLCLERRNGLGQDIDRAGIVAETVVILAEEVPHATLECRVAELLSNDERTIGVVDGALTLGDFVIVVPRKCQDPTQTAPIPDGVSCARRFAEYLDDPR